jgi:CHAT domain-containing protein
VTVNKDPRTTEEILDASENALRQFLQLKAPPNYIARILEKSELPEDASAWSKILKTIKVDDPRFERVHFLPLYEPTISHLNYILYENHVDRLDETISRLRPLCEAPGKFSSSAQRTRGVECLSYLLTERHVGWFYSAAATQLNPYHSSVLDALDWAEEALKLSLDSSDYFLASRAAYNIGRIHAIAGLSPEAVATLVEPTTDWRKKEAERFANARIRREFAIRPFFQSLDFLSKASAQIESTDEHGWQGRSIEALYHLVRFFTTADPRTPRVLAAIVEHIKTPRLARKVGQRMRKQCAAADDLIAVTDTSPGVLFDLGAIASLLDSETAVFNFTILDDFVSLTLIQGGQATNNGMNPNRVVGLLQRFFRPAAAQFEGIRGIGIGNAHSLSWKMSQDMIHITPHADDQWTMAVNRNAIILDPIWHRVLHDQLIAPFEARLAAAGVKHLVFMADLALMLIPFQLLENSNGVPLGQRYRISYCPSYALLVDALTHQMKSGRAESVLIVADPTETLPFVPWEHAMIASLFSPDKVRVLDASTASRQAVALAVRDFDVVHFATHGRFDSEDTARSGVNLGSDGWLTLEDMQQLEFKDEALIFLSACETARLNLSGRSTPLGIVPSLFEGGASTIIATFWRVNDRSTALVAARFYENWLVRKLSRLDSLAEATQWVQTVSADDAIKLSQQPVALSSARSMDSIFAGLKNWLGRPDEQVRPFTNSYYWGPFGLYGAWN